MSGICDTCKRNRDCRKPIGGMDSCRLYVSGKESNYKKLFGSPERAAETMFTLMLNCARGDGPCERCPAYPRCNWASDDGEETESMMLEWLEGESQ